MTSTKSQLGIESLLWETANTLRGSMDSSDYKHVVLGMLFLKYLFDLQAHPDYRSATLNTGELDWNVIVKASKSPSPGKAIDRVVLEVEKLNPALRDAFPRMASYEGMAPDALRRLVELFGPIDFAAAREAGKDLLSRTYEYFHSSFAAAEGRLGGEFYTPLSIVRLMVGLLEPFSGTLYDPACGTGGLLIQAQSSANANNWDFTDVVAYGQESNPMTWRLARLNLALHGIKFDLGERWGDTFSEDRHPELRADFIMTNPPFGKGTTWPRQALALDERWQYGLPPENPANFAWMQHYLARLSPSGTAVTVMPNGTLTSRGTEGDIRAAMVNDDRVEAVILLPNQLFYSTPIPVSLWLLTHDKSRRAALRDRRGEVLLIDGRNLGFMTSKVHRDLSDDDIEKLSQLYKRWRREGLSEADRSIAVSVTRDQLAERGYSLNPSEYIETSVEFDVPALLQGAKPMIEEVRRAADSAREVMQTLENKFADGEIGLRVRRKTGPTWPTLALREVASVVGGGTPDTKVPQYFGNDVPWITPRDLASHASRDISRGERSLTREGLDSCGARLVPAGSVLVSSRAPIGLVAVAGCELATNQGIRSLVLRGDQDPRYWYYLLRSSTARLNAAGNGTTFLELRGSSLASMTFQVPPHSEQIEIADWLDHLESTADTAQVLAGNARRVIDALAPALASGYLSAKR